MDHGVTGGENRATLFVKPEALVGDVAGYCRYPVGGHLVEGLVPEVLPEAIEGVVAEDVPVDPALGPPPARSDDENEVAVGHGAQQSLHQGCAEEACAARDGNAAPSQGFSNHDTLFTRWSGSLPVGREAATVGV